MTVRILVGDVRDGRFKPGQHWRPRRPHWERSWLVTAYEVNLRSAADIAVEAGCTENGILYWLEKHGIARRSISQARAQKYWGLTGNSNPMFGKYGELNPAYIDGSSPERQRLYARGDGKAFLRLVYERDNYRCRRCGAPKTVPRSLHAHHIKPWAGNVELRFDPENAVTLCRNCHAWVHSRRNVDREYLS